MYGNRGANYVKPFTSHTGVDCGSLPNPGNGGVSLSGTVFGSVATYNCNDGFTLEGETTRQCESSGLWSGTPPTCKREN